MKSGERIAGVDEIVYPGERGQRRAAELTARGRAPLDPVAWRTLETVCNELGVPLPT